AVSLTPRPPTSPLSGREGGSGGEDATRSSVITVGDAVPHAGQNAAPRGISLRHDGQVSRVVTGPKICVRDARCKLVSPDAGAPDCHWPRALVRRTRAPRLEVPGAARLSGAAGSRARSELRRCPERRESGASRRRRDEAGRVVPETEVVEDGAPQPASGLLWFYGNGENIAA